MTNIYDIIEAVHNKLDTYSALNRGGCGVAAERIYARLAELGHAPRILCTYGAYGTWVCMDGIRSNIIEAGDDVTDSSNWRDADDYPLSFNHVILSLYVDGEHYYFDGHDSLEVDGDGYVSGMSCGTSYGKFLGGELTQKELQMFNVADIWNSRFTDCHSPKKVRADITRTIRKTAKQLDLA